jgi:hypothetical protein
LFLVFSNSAKCQNTFKEFINLFPSYKWNDLPEVISTLPLGKKLDIDRANKFMWEEHSRGIRLPVNNYTWEVNGPHIMLENGSYDRAGLGMFNKDSNRPDKKSNSLTAVAKVNLNSEIIVLITYYDVFDLEMGYKKIYDAYTYRLKDEKLISALEISDAIIFDDLKIIGFKTFYKGEDEESFRVSYELRQDGYFQRMKKNSVSELIKNEKLKRYVVFDMDGSANIREQPKINSKVIFSIKNGELILVEETNDPNWFRVASLYVTSITNETLPEVYKDRQYYPICGGYIHKSRVKEYNE